MACNYSILYEASSCPSDSTCDSVLSLLMAWKTSGGYKNMWPHQPRMRPEWLPGSWLQPGPGTVAICAENQQKKNLFFSFCFSFSLFLFLLLSHSHTVSLPVCFFLTHCRFDFQIKIFKKFLLYETIPLGRLNMLSAVAQICWLTCATHVHASISHERMQQYIAHK